MEKNSSLIGLASIILTGLIIGYFLLITNPPPDLLRYNENLKMAVTYHLSGSEIINHFGSISIFILTFFLISALLMFVTSEIVSEKKWGRLPVEVALTLISIIVLGIIGFPYYGFRLTMILYSTGMMGGIIGFRRFHRLGCPFVFCSIAPGFIIFMWALGDIESLVYSLGALAILSILIMIMYLKLEKIRQRG